MRSTVRRCLVAALLVGCGPDITYSEPPFLRGIITSRSAMVYGVRDESGIRLDSVPAMFVDGRGIWPAPEPCAAQARLWLSDKTRVLRNGGLADTTALVVGQPVAIWVSGVILDSCPPQAGASRVVLEPRH